MQISFIIGRDLSNFEFRPPILQTLSIFTKVQVTYVIFAQGCATAARQSSRTSGKGLQNISITTRRTREEKATFTFDIRLRLRPHSNSRRNSHRLAQRRSTRRRHSNPRPPVRTRWECRVVRLRRSSCTTFRNQFGVTDNVNRHKQCGSPGFVADSRSRSSGGISATETIIVRGEIKIVDMYRYVAAIGTRFVLYGFIRSVYDLFIHVRPGEYDQYDATFSPKIFIFSPQILI